MPEIAASTVFGGTLLAADGGAIEIDPGAPMETYGPLQATDYGVAFGPLELIAYPESTIRVGGLRFLENPGFVETLFGHDDEEDDEDSLFGLLALLAAPAAAGRLDHDHDGIEDESPVTRRNVLKSAAVIGGAATATAGIAAAETTLGRARFAVTENPAGIRIRIRDRIADVFPTDEEYYTFLDGREYDSFQPATLDSYGDILPESAGTVTVGPSGSAGSILTRALGGRDKTYDGLTLSKDISDAAAGEELLITDNDILVDTIQATGADHTVCRINGESIPHIHEATDNPVGHYAVSDDQLIYEVGAEPPAGQTATITVYAGTTTELADDIQRRVD